LITGSTKTSNRRQAEAVLAKHLKEAHDETMLGAKKSVLVKDAIDMFLESRVGTKGYMSAVVKLRLFAPLNKKKFEEVSAREARQLASNAVASNKFTINTVNVSITYWNAVVNLLHDNKYKVAEKLKKLTGGGGRIRFLTDVEEKALLAELDPEVKDANGDYVFREKRKAQDNYDYVIACLHTGARDMEVASIKMSQIDLDKNTLTIIRSKGGLNTTFTMSTVLREMVKRRIAFGLVPRRQGQGPQGRAVDGYLFPAKSKAKSSKDWLDNAAERAGLEDVSPHVFRHTYAVNMLKANVNVVEVQHLLGHKNLNSTQVYLHVLPQLAAARAADVLNARG
jgi:integrase